MRIIADDRIGDKYEFVWPTGNKTIILGQGKGYSINGEAAVMVAKENFSLCARNTESGNIFCFKALAGFN